LLENSDKNSGRRGLIIAVFVLVFIILTGTFGYMAIEGYSALEAIYMTIITVTTVGFGEIKDLTPGGRVFTMFLIVTSFGTFAYAVTMITTHLIELQMNYFLTGTNKKFIGRKMKNHVIVCGYGRNGRQTASELLAYHHQFVVIDNNHDIVTANNSNDIRFIEGDGTEDDILLSAGIKHAKALIACLPADADNLFIALTARSLNPNLTIISRAASESSEKKLRMAGVDQIVLPEKVGGAHMAKLVTRADVVEFLEHLSIRGDDPTNIVEIECKSVHESWKGKTIAELGVRMKTGANIIGLKNTQGEYIVNPSSDTRLEFNSKLFVLGTDEQIDHFNRILAAPES
jgi:voltage-gated potassium channel